MSSKRKSPPTKLDGSNGISDSKHSSQDADVIPSAEIDLSIKSSPHLIDPETSRISPDVRHLDPNSEINRHNQLNGERLSGKVKRRGGDIQVRECRWICSIEYLINSLSLITVIIASLLPPESSRRRLSPTRPSESPLEASEK